MDELQAEIALLRKIIGVLVEDAAGGQVIIPIERLESASDIDIQTSGDGQDDELTVYSLYPQ